MTLGTSVGARVSDAMAAFGRTVGGLTPPLVAKWRGIARPRIDRHNGVSREKGTELGTGSATVGWCAKTPGTATAITRRGLSFQPPNDARYHRRRIFACRLEELVVAR